jgi:hypothetical protein
VADESGVDPMIDHGTCPVCEREKVHLNAKTGKLNHHLRQTGKAKPRYEMCPGSYTPPAGSRAV